VIGGNLSRGAQVSITTTLLGSAIAPVRRDGAKVGHVLALCGSVGLAAAGLRLLMRDRHGETLDQDCQTAIAAFRRPVARIADGLRCARIASSLIDISDGLAQDAAHLAQASGVRIDIDIDAVVDAQLHRLACAIGVDAERLALHGGDDYALLATVPADSVPAEFRIIGRCVEGSGVWCKGRPVEPAGHDHFR
jgi:thiamine-monophosphate kinase